MMSRHYYAAQAPRGFSNETNVVRFASKAARDRWVREHRHDGGVNCAACGAEAVTAKDAHRIASREGNVIRDHLPRPRRRQMDRQCAIERLASECAAEAVRVGGSDPTDEAGDSLLPARPLPADYEALADLLDGSVTCRQVDAFDEAYKATLEDAQQA
jgi:hypothetical protein